MPIEQDFLIFIGRIDFAPCDGEIGSLAIVYQVAELTTQLAPGKNAKAVRGLRPRATSHQ